MLLALQQPRGLVFGGTFGALAVMSVISVALGRLLHEADEALPFHSSIPWDDYAAVALLLFFGIKTLLESNAPKAEEEQAGAQEAVAEMGGGSGAVDGAGAAAAAAGVVASTFALVFAAEWGDKSFLATIALSAASDPLGVVAGACAGHATPPPSRSRAALCSASTCPSAPSPSSAARSSSPSPPPPPSSSSRATVAARRPGCEAGAKRASETVRGFKHTRETTRDAATHHTMWTVDLSIHSCPKSRWHFSRRMATASLKSASGGSCPQLSSVNR